MTPLTRNPPYAAFLLRSFAVAALAGALLLASAPAAASADLGTPYYAPPSVLLDC